MVDSVTSDIFEIFLGFIVMVTIFSIFATWVICKCTPIIYHHLKLKLKMIQSNLN